MLMPDQDCRHVGPDSKGFSVAVATPVQAVQGPSMKLLHVPAGKLLPHRPPMLCIDTLIAFDDASGLYRERPGGVGGEQRRAVALVNTRAETETHLHAGHLLLHNRVLTEAGCVELAAQSVAAMKGYAETMLGMPVGEGFLAAVRDFSFTGQAREGDTLRIAVGVTAEVAGVSLVEAVIRRCASGKNSSVLARGSLKVYTPDNAGPLR
jgi:predicted hotdog family 3-hydroxylacyl-ACP dehydratase